MVRRALNLALLVAAGIAASIARAEEDAIEQVELDTARSHAEFGVKIM